MVVRYAIPLILFIVLSGCNLPEWNQKRLTKKFERKEVEEKFLRTDDHTIHYFEGGVGETVLLIHGFGGDAQITWSKTIADLSKDHHVIAPDLMWFGQSESQKDPELMTQVDAILTLLEDRKVDKCTVAGISYGGFVTLGLQYAKPYLIEKMIIVDSPGMTFDISLLDTLCKAQGVDEVQDIFVVQDPEGVEKLLNLGANKDRNIPKGILEDTYQLYFSQHHRQLYQLLETLPAEQSKFNDYPMEKWPPTLVIWGENDAVFPLKEGKKLADYLKAEFKVVPKAGHAANIDNPKVFNTYFRAFLEN